VSEISIEVRGLEETARRMEQAVTDLQGTPIVGAMRESTLLVERYAKLAAPVDTGRLRASITPVVVSSAGEVKGIVGSNVVYAPYQELGTKKMKAHPYLRPAFERARQQIIGFFESAIAAITRRANG